MAWLGADKGIRDLHGKVAVVTGAAGGIGRALAFALMGKGSHLALVDQDSDGLSRLRADIGPRERQRVTTHVANLADADRARAVSIDVARAHGGVHVLINNAGIAHEAAFPQTSLDDWRRVMDANLWSAVHATYFFLPNLAKAERSHIVNMSSLFGVVAMPGQTAYCASKFAVRGFSEALQEELHTTAVGLTVVYPSAVATDIMRRALGDDRELLERIHTWYQRRAIRPERAAAAIIRAIERGTPRLRIGGESVLGDILKRLLPVVGNTMFVDAVIRALGVEDMRAKRMKQWHDTMVAPQAKAPQ